MARDKDEGGSASKRPAPAIGDDKDSVSAKTFAAVFVNRELSFLEFQERILDEADDPEVPLLERLKFLGIVSSNLDEFFMIRVAGLAKQVESGVLETGPDGMLPGEQIASIFPRVARQVARQEKILLETVIPTLAAEGIHLLRSTQLAESAKQTLKARFTQAIFPLLTPMAVDSGHPFPFLKNGTLNLAVHLVPDGSPEDAAPLRAVVQVPGPLPAYLEVPHPGELAIVPTVDVIQLFVGELFTGMRIVECVPFRVLRNWDLEVDEDEQEDLLEVVRKELVRRTRHDAVLLQFGASGSGELAAWLTSAFELSPLHVERHRAPFPLSDVLSVLDRVGRPDLRDEPFVPVRSPDLREDDDLFAEISRHDVLLHHPYESYDPVVELVMRAASDPAVLAIKQSLYRVNKTSPIVGALITAAEHGKQVTALVELKARFDEETNVTWALALEQAGVHVVYGMAGLKTHCKVTLVVRREVNGIRTYVHLGTGNYNEKTARVYSDLSLFTAHPEVAADVSALFNLLTGYAEPPAWKKLVVAPLDLRRNLIEHIDRARSVAKKGGVARIILKTNALVDAEVIRALCRAAQRGAEVVLLVRGPFGLRVGVPGVSDRIVVRTIVDRFLEHSRLFYFRYDDVEEVFITSTDVMPRNFDRRLEVMLPVEDERIRRRIIDEILGVELSDTTKAAVLSADGTFQRIRAKAGKRVRAQATFISLARQRATGAKPRELPTGRKKGKRREA
ncbi:MAG: polyphosphate kinase 1 [Deltaproteobacteria bacterium]|nr:polyphosphate kinase 1 [Deltaproteobacteria bacterium]